MGLVTSGTISIGGSTSGRSVNLELGNNATDTGSLGDSAFRTLSGISSGAIGLYNFYGKSNGPPQNTVGVFFGGFILGDHHPKQITTRINASGTLIGSETNVGDADGRARLAGAGLGTTGVFYAGISDDNDDNDCVNTVTRINSSGTLIGSEDGVGAHRSKLAGAGLGTTGVFYAGIDWSNEVRIVTRINASGIQIGSETNVGTYRGTLAGAGLGTTGVFYGGAYHSDELSTVTRINTSGTLIGGETNVGTAREKLTGTGLGTTGVFYGGIYNRTEYNKVTRINTSGTLIGSETQIGTPKYDLAGARLGTTGVFYGGYSDRDYLNTVTRINASGVQIGSATNVGSNRIYLAGAGVL